MATTRNLFCTPTTPTSLTGFADTPRDRGRRQGARELPKEAVQRCDDPAGSTSSTHCAGRPVAITSGSRIVLVVAVPPVTNAFCPTRSRGMVSMIFAARSRSCAPGESRCAGRSGRCADGGRSPCRPATTRMPLARGVGGVQLRGDFAHLVEWRTVRSRHEPVRPRTGGRGLHPCAFSVTCARLVTARACWHERDCIVHFGARLRQPL